jgi:glutaminyl-tRNA synthetase
LPESRSSLRGFLSVRIGSGALRTVDQVRAALDFVEREGGKGAVDSAAFDAACGVGVVFTQAQLEERARDIMAGAGAALPALRYAFPLHTLQPRMKDGKWRWAEGKALNDAWNAAVSALLGKKTAEDDAFVALARKEKAVAVPQLVELLKKHAGVGGALCDGAKAALAALAAEGGSGGSGGGGGGGVGGGGAPATSTASALASAAAAAVDAAGDAASLVAAFAARSLESARNSARLAEEHARAMGGRVRTRFPPEPNGFLHIGHAKSMNLNFDGAFRLLGVAPGGGETIFRYDDTNPDAESVEYIENQAENVAWMGWKPVRVTHSSDYFPQLYEFAVRLIKMGKAYVCHQTKADIEASREIARAKDGRSADSPWRNRPVEESLAEFEAMRAGRFEEGAVCLRLKIDMASANPTLWDPVAYRIKYTPHPHTGAAWCIYPSYDFSHSIIDSLEHIDYSLCTLEFEVRRDLYYWTLEALDLWRPHVWEFARLNITHVQLSKRKILSLVTTKRVRGWDDPRIPTINGLRRRGYTAEAINAFCRDIGVSRNDNTVEHSKLEYHIRAWRPRARVFVCVCACAPSSPVRPSSPPPLPVFFHPGTHLDEIAPRTFVVLHPLRLELTNLDPSFLSVHEAPDFPRAPAAGSHRLTLTNVVYIDVADFREVDAPDYFGLAPGKVAGLRYAGYVRVTEVVRDGAGRVAGLKGVYDAARSADFAGGGAVKGNLHWVSGAAPGAAPPAVEVRLYDHLFSTTAPGSTGDWEAELNPASEVVLRDALAAPQLLEAAAAAGGTRHFQFERVGFFVVDPDSRAEEGRLVFNSVVGLKERTETKKARGGEAH